MAREDRGRREVGYCPHCGNDSPQRSVGAHSSGTDDPKGPTNYAFVVCETCDRVLLYQAGYITRTIAQSITPIFSVKDYKLVWPNAEKLHSSVPNSVCACYVEAAGIKNRSPNGFANQIRRTLEMLCKDRGATTRILAENLKELSARGEIPSVLAEMTDVLRMLGNIGSHAAEESVEPEFVDAIDDFFRGR